MLAFLVGLWIAIKGALARAFDAPDQRRPLPAFQNPTELAAYLAANFIYTGDGGPGGGLYDHYTHPEHVSYWIAYNLENKLYGTARRWPLHVDCDDVSSFAYLASLAMPGVVRRQMFVFRYPSVAVALADLWRNLRAGRPYLLYFHEACVIWHASGTFLINQNGVTPVADEWAAAVYLGQEYDVTYVPQAVPYPFEVPR